MARKIEPYDPSVIKRYSNKKLGRMLENLALLDERTEAMERGMETIIERLSIRGFNAYQPVLARINEFLHVAAKTAIKERAELEKVYEADKAAQTVKGRIQSLYDRLQQRFY